MKVITDSKKMIEGGYSKNNSIENKTKYKTVKNVANKVLQLKFLFATRNIQNNIDTFDNIIYGFL